MSKILFGMAFLFDSLAALVLFAACVTAWRLCGPSRAASRINIRFAAMLMAALAVARGLAILQPELGALVSAVAVIATSLAAAALALGLFAVLARPLPPLAASAGLGLALGAGLTASLSGAPVYALACQIVCVSLTLAASLGALPSRMHRAALAQLASVSLLCGGFALTGGADDCALLFFAAGLIGAARASQLGVETQRERDGGLAVKAFG